MPRDQTSVIMQEDYVRLNISFTVERHNIGITSSYIDLHARDDECHD